MADPVGTGSPTAVPDEWALIEQAFIAARVKANGGKALTPEEQTAIKNSIQIAKERLGFTGDQATALRKLFTTRPDLALKVSQNIIDVGKKAAETEIGLQDKAQTGAIDLAKLAGATDIEVQGVTAKFFAGWVGPIQMLGKFLCKFDATRGFGEACLNYASEITPAPISDKTAVERLDRENRRVAIDERKAATSQMSVWGQALAMTRSDVAGVTPEAGADAQAEIGKINGANGKAGPAYEPPPAAAKPGAAAAPAAAPAASAAVNLGQIAKDLVARADKVALGDKAKLNDGQAVAQAMELRKIDKAGNSSNFIDTDAELAAYKKSAAYNSLTDDQKKTMDTLLTPPKTADGKEGPKLKVAAAVSAPELAPTVT